MNGRNERILFAAVLVLTGLLSWLRMGESYARTRVATARPAPLLEVERPPTIALGALAETPPSRRAESIWAPPRELLPLDPLELPQPPLPPLSVRRPATEPALAGALSAAYRVPASSIGALSLEAEGGGADDGAPLAGAATVVATGAAGGDSGTAPLEERFDWVVRTDKRPRLYGRILNDDPIGLFERPGEVLRFQQLSESTGGRLGAPLEIPREEVIEFGLAQTPENRYRLRSAGLGNSATARRTYAVELLRAALDDPTMLPFAREEAAAAFAAGPTDPANARVLAAAHRAAHDLEAELALYVRAEKEGWADPALLASHARLVGRLGLGERAAQLVAHGKTLGRPVGELALQEGRLLAAAGQREQALALLREAENLPFLGPFEERQRHELSLEIGALLVGLGQADEALREAGRVLLDDPRSAEGFTLRGAAHAALGQLGPAAEAFQSALAIDAQSSSALTNAAIVAWQQGDGATARRLLENAIDADPLRAVRPTLALGFLHEDAGNREAARDLYAQALLLEPGQPEALYRLGRNQRIDGDPEEAVRTLRKALRLTGPDLLLLLELGRACLDLSRHDEAARYFREAERLAPQDAEVQWYLGLAMLRAGDVVMARVPLTAAAGAGARGAHGALGTAAYRRGDARAALEHYDEVAKAYAGAEGDPQAVYAATMAERIRDNLSKRQWVDRFGRSSLQRGWTEHVWDGSPRVYLDGEAVVVEGRMERSREDERPGLSRPVEGRGFFGVQAEVARRAGTEARVGLALTYAQVKGAQGRLPKARVQISIDETGQVRLDALDNFDTVLLAGAAVDGAVVPADVPVLLGIERLDEEAGRFAFTLDGQRVGEPLELRSLRGFKNAFDLSVWADAAPGRTVGAALSLVRIVQAP